MPGEGHRPAFHARGRGPGADGSRALLDGGTFGDLAKAMLVLQRITREGTCALTDPSDPGLPATCYPPARVHRTRVLRAWF